MRLSDITPLILTYNEAPNIERTLAGLAWAERVVVVDSCSDDGTVEICRNFRNVEVVQRPFDDHTTQWNFGLSLVATPWVLALDADYVVDDAVVRELQELREDGVDGYFARFTYCVRGRPLRGTIYPPRQVLFRPDKAQFVTDGHTQLLELRGRSGWLESRILHDDRKPLARWFSDQVRYASLEASHLSRHGTQLSAIDRVRRRAWAAPFLVLAYTLIGQRVLLDGWRGWYYALQRTVAEILLALYLIDRRIAGEE